MAALQKFYGKMAKQKESNNKEMEKTGGFSGLFGYLDEVWMSEQIFMKVFLKKVPIKVGFVLYLCKRLR